MRRLSKVKIKWSSNFAYAIGLITTDGNLSIDGRHIDLTSKDLVLIEEFIKCLNIKNKIGKKARGGSDIKKYFRIQFGDKNFYDFLLSLGLTPTKSKTLGPLKIPKKYFPDFLRGCIDGDGSIGIFKHPESQHPQLRVRLFSASTIFLQWIKRTILINVKIKTGWIEEKNDISTLIYAKKDSIKLLNYIYYSNVEYYLKRKYNVARVFLRM